MGNLEIQEEITAIKTKMSDGKTWFKDGKLMTEVSVSDFNELLRLAYNADNYRLNCTWNLEKTAESNKSQYELLLKIKKAYEDGDTNKLDEVLHGAFTNEVFEDY